MGQKPHSGLMDRSCSALQPLLFWTTTLRLQPAPAWVFGHLMLSLYFKCRQAVQEPRSSPPLFLPWNHYCLSHKPASVHTWLTGGTVTAPLVSLWSVGQCGWYACTQGMHDKKTPWCLAEKCDGILPALKAGGDLPWSLKSFRPLLLTTLSREFSTCSPWQVQSAFWSNSRHFPQSHSSFTRTKFQVLSDNLLQKTISSAAWLLLCYAIWILC